MGWVSTLAFVLSSASVGSGRLSISTYTFFSAFKQNGEEGKHEEEEFKEKEKY
jgi:hypothetical protein